MLKQLSIQPSVMKVSFEMKSWLCSTIIPEWNIEYAVLSFVFLYIWFSYLYIYLIRKQILIDLFSIDAAAFLLKLWPHLAQSLMWWRKSKGQTTFKWHFHDISLARLTFGSFFPPSFLYVLHVFSSFLFLPSTTSQTWMSTNRTKSKSHFSTAWAPLQSSTIEKAVIRFHLKGWQAIFNIASKLIKKIGMWSFSGVLLGSVTSLRVLSVFLDIRPFL